MIAGVGIDLVEIERVKNAISHHPGFLPRLFTAEEQHYCLSKARPYLHFAVRFAAKEAVLKAIGTGFRGVKWTDLEIKRDSLGKPYVQLNGKAALICCEKGISEILISLSFSRGNAIATAIAVKKE